MVEYRRVARSCSPVAPPCLFRTLMHFDTCNDGGEGMGTYNITPQAWARYSYRVILKLLYRVSWPRFQTIRDYSQGPPPPRGHCLCKYRAGGMSAPTLPAQLRLHRMARLDTEKADSGPVCDRQRSHGRRALGSNRKWLAYLPPLQTS